MSTAETTPDTQTETTTRARLEISIAPGVIFPDWSVVASDGNESNMRVSSASSGSVLEKVLAKLSNEALIAECRRRGLEVGDV